MCPRNLSNSFPVPPSLSSNGWLGAAAWQPSPGAAGEDWSAGPQQLPEALSSFAAGTVGLELTGEFSLGPVPEAAGCFLSSHQS